LFSINRFSVILLAFVSIRAAAQAPLWEPGKVVAVEQVSSPARTPDPSCRAVPKGTTPPARCRPSNLRAEQFWRVTIDVGNKRFVVRPYRAASLLDSLNQAETVYVDPNLTAASPVEVALVSSKAVRLRTDQGPGIPAIVDSQELLSNPEAPLKAELSPPPRARATASVTSASRVVLLENSDFRDLEVQEFKSQDIGDGAALYSFTGDSSETRTGSNTPVFLVLADSETAMPGNVELSRLQVGKGTRQVAYSLTKNHSASSLPIIVTPVSATLRKVTVRDPLPPGQYVVLLENNSNRGFLFDVR
jgi:hypothetical protein